eukprot:747966-Hanusia_phi.AAC.1
MHFAACQTASDFNDTAAHVCHTGKSRAQGILALAQVCQEADAIISSLVAETFACEDRCFYRLQVSSQRVDERTRPVGKKYTLSNHELLLLLLLLLLLISLASSSSLRQVVQRSRSMDASLNIRSLTGDEVCKRARRRTILSSHRRARQRCCRPRRGSCSLSLDGGGGGGTQ